MRRFTLLLVPFLLPAVAHAQLPLDTELLIGGDFEAPSLAAWNVAGAMQLEFYGAPSNPNLFVGLAIGGGAQCVGDLVGSSTLWQSFDLTGNSAAVDAGQLSVHLEGYFGGVTSEGDKAKLRARFLNSAGTEIGSGETDPAGAHERNFETVLLKRITDIPIPPLTRTLEIRLEMAHVQGGTADGLADNLSAKLTVPVGTVTQPLGVNLLGNSDFEGGSVPGSFLELNDPNTWKPSPAALTLETYGAPGNPSSVLGAAIGGGARMIHGNYGNSAMGQTFDVAGNAAAIDSGQLYIELGGDLGGITSDGDGVSIEAEFRNFLGGSMGSVSTGSVGPHERNFETVLLRELKQFQIPTFTREIEVRVVTHHVSGGTADGRADNIIARLIAPPVFQPQPLDTELVTNPGFENGYDAGSFHTPASLRGWRPTLAMLTLENYGSATYPDLGVSALIGGGAVMVRGASGNSRMRQSIDLRGNAAEIDLGLLWLRLGGHFGGLGGDGDRAELQVTFLDALETVINTEVDGPIEYWNRMSQTTLLRSEEHVPVPAGARTMLLDLVTSHIQGGTADGLADNLSAELTLAPPSPVPTGVELIVNGGFETGEMLSPSNPGGWMGTAGPFNQIESYGSPVAPTIAHAQAIGGGSYLVGDYFGGNALMEQRFDLRGNAAQVDIGTMSLRVSAFLGGTGNDSDSCQVNIRCLNSLGGQLLSSTTGAVSVTDRNFITQLLQRVIDVPIPAMTRTVIVEVAMNFVSGGTADGLVDNVSAVLTDSLGTPGTYPGTGEDLILLTGVDAPVSSGPLFDVKLAPEGSQLDITLLSPTGSFEFAPIYMLADFGPTGMFPQPLPLPGVALSGTGLLVLVDGITLGGGFGTQFLLPGGSTYSFVIPFGLAGNSVIIQAFVLPSLAPSPFLPAPAANGVYATTNGHELQIVP